MKIGDIAEAPTPYCIFVMEDGSVECRKCDEPPEGGIYKGRAPKGTQEGVVDAEVLNRLPVGE
jgi:hypothetical protein